MKPKRQPSPQGDQELHEVLSALGIDPTEDFSDLRPEDISATPRDQWEDCTEVIPPPSILRYLASDDTLTDHTIDMMELAIEKAYKVTSPWFITSTRSGSAENGDLKVKRFTLMRES